MNEVRRAVSENWRENIDNLPTTVHLTIASYRTTVELTVAAGGELVAVTITETSGMAELDDAVVNAVRAAAPFAKPDPVMLGPDGRTPPESFDFILDVGRAPAPPSPGAPKQADPGNP